MQKRDRTKLFTDLKKIWRQNNFLFFYSIMVEQLQNKETSPERAILKETKQQLSTLKEQILSKNLEPKREGFGDYLQNN